LRAANFARPRSGLVLLDLAAGALSGLLGTRGTPRLKAGRGMYYIQQCAR
jgi:hypothetical protein